MKAGILLLALIGIAAPAHARTIEDNEPLVMRVIFDECLRYIREDGTPFEGLAAGPASPDSLEGSHVPRTSIVGLVQLLSPRYVAVWGADVDARFCMVSPVRKDRDRIGPARLGVRAAGFVGRVTQRAVKEGLPEHFGRGELSPLTINSWSEPETGHDIGPERPISFSILPSDGDAASGRMDVGLIVMGGPPLPSRN